MFKRTSSFTSLSDWVNWGWYLWCLWNSSPQCWPMGWWGLSCLDEDEMLVTLTRSMLYMSMPCYNWFFLLLFEGFGLSLYADLPSDAWQKFIGFQPCRTSPAWSGREEVDWNDVYGEGRCLGWMWIGLLWQKNSWASVLVALRCNKWF